jgi:hypothetical protein
LACNRISRSNTVSPRRLRRLFVNQPWMDQECTGCENGAWVCLHSCERRRAVQPAASTALHEHRPSSAQRCRLQTVAPSEVPRARERQILTPTEVLGLLTSADLCAARTSACSASRRGGRRNSHRARVVTVRPKARGPACVHARMDFTCTEASPHPTLWSIHVSWPAMHACQRYT